MGYTDGSNTTVHIKNESALREKSNLFQTYKEEYWVIHGKSYKLDEFAKTHPGGEYILMLGKGRDCTELFESAHALAGIEKPRQILAKYEVKDEEPKKDLFMWKEDGFYSVLRDRVHKRFQDRNYKATWGVCIKIWVMLFLYLGCWTKAFLTGNWLWAAASGVLTEMIGFCLMHDSSHNALSKKSWVNYSGLLWSAWTMWNHWLWLQHHVYGHHSHTGIFGKDPDIHNTEFLMRKNLKMRLGRFSAIQKYYVWLIYTVAPNQHIGQMILYVLLPALTKKLFGVVEVKKPSDNVQLHSYMMMALSIVWHVAIPLYFQSIGTVALLWFVNYTMMGVSYFLNVAPNHDTESTLRVHPSESDMLDWGEHQVKCTGNHSIGDSLVDKLITQLWGGMNYQVEHHLFPALNHAHYPEVSKIVQQTCKEFDVPYTSEGDWFTALHSFGRFINIMGLFPRYHKYNPETDLAKL